MDSKLLFGIKNCKRILRNLSASRLLFYFLLSLVLTGCRVLEDSKLAEFYHNVTARYNGYFNAREITKDMEEQFRDNYQDNFSEILDIYRFPGEAKAKGLKSQADRVIKKCTRVIQKHPTANLIDECYLLIGKAYFYKNEFFSARENFLYVRGKYPNTETAGLANVWIVLSHIMQENYKESNALLTSVQSEEKFPETYQKDLLLASAYMAINNEAYSEATKPLKKAIPKYRDRDLEARYLFILGQLYQRTGSYTEAITAYRRSLKKNPPYKMAFNARMNLAECFRNSDLRTSNDLKRDLLKMLKDDKNIEYFNQIYFQLAQIELDENNTEQAKKYFEKSIKSGKSNPNQKAIAYNALGNYYYKKKNYPLARGYFDSASMFLSPKIENYEEFKENQETLRELLRYLAAIQEQDSLQRLATMDPGKLKKKIALIAKKEEEMASRKKQRERARERGRDTDRFGNQPFGQRDQQKPSDPGASDPFLNTNRSGKWYFYNPVALGRGSSEFANKWGNRSLEDNWRRSQKQSSFSRVQTNPGEAGQDTMTQDTAAQTRVPDHLSDVPPARMKYYQNIPFTEAQKAASDQIIMEALFNAGKIYFEDLKNYSKGIDYLNRLIKRFPGSNWELPAYYYLYKIHKSLGDKKKAKKYRLLILKKFPDSRFAEFLKNPEMLEKWGKVYNPKLERYYDSFYQNFRDNNCPELHRKLRKADSAFSNNYLKFKMEYLTLLCEGKKQPVAEFIKSLKKFIDDHPGEPVTAHAQNTIQYLETKQKGGTSDKAKALKPKNTFRYKEDIKHYYFIIFNIREKEGLLVKQKLAQYNDEYYSLKDFKLSDRVFKGKYQMVVVRSFNNKPRAYEYLLSIETDQEFQKKLNLSDYNHYIISSKNYLTLINKNNLDAYRKFYQKNY